MELAARGHTLAARKFLQRCGSRAGTPGALRLRDYATAYPASSKGMPASITTGASQCNSATDVKVAALSLTLTLHTFLNKVELVSATSAIVTKYGRVSG